MLSKLISWFESQTAMDKDTQSQQKIDLATAVLLYEIMRADDKFCEQEESLYRQLLQAHFAMPPEDLDILIELTAQRAAEAVDFAQFTQVINRNCEPAEKRDILQLLWQIAYADQVLDPHEEYLIRCIADLLYLPHSQFIQTKLAVLEKLEKP
jgi:uncharacterized tellurite resistance protein B-like protein